MTKNCGRADFGLVIGIWSLVIPFSTGAPNGLPRRNLETYHALSVFHLTATPQPGRAREVVASGERSVSRRAFCHW